LKTVKLPYLRNCLTDFDEIWSADAEPVSSLTPSAVKKYQILKLCVWAGVGGVCNVSSGMDGWWRGRSDTLTSLLQCHSLDHPAGLHWIRYRPPANYSQPDEVLTALTHRSHVTVLSHGIACLLFLLN